MVEKLPTIFQLFLALTSIYSMFIFPFAFMISDLRKAKPEDKLYRVWQILLIILITLLFLLLIPGIQLASINKRNEGNKQIISMVLTCYMIIVCIWQVISIINTSSKKVLNAVLGTITIVILNLYIFFIFGLCNMQINDWNAITNSINFNILLRVIGYDTKYSSNPPNITPTCNMMPLIQYFIIRFYDIYIMGFLLAYFYDLIKPKQEDNSYKTN